MKLGVHQHRGWNVFKSCDWWEEDHHKKFWYEVGQVDRVTLLHCACLWDNKRSKNGNISFMVPHNLEFNGRQAIGSWVHKNMNKNLAESVLPVRESWWQTREPLSSTKWIMKNRDSIRDAWHDAFHMTGMITKVAGRWREMNCENDFKSRTIVHTDDVHSWFLPCWVDGGYSYKKIL